MPAAKHRLLDVAGQESVAVIRYPRAVSATRLRASRTGLGLASGVALSLALVSGRVTTLPPAPNIAAPDLAPAVRPAEAPTSAKETVKPIVEDDIAPPAAPAFDAEAWTQNGGAPTEPLPRRSLHP